MSLIGTVANYGGRQPDNFSNIKQFVIGSDNLAVWIYKTTPGGITVQTPANKKTPLYVDNDFYITGSLYNTSDINLKDNIATINESTFHKILDLKPVEYTFKTDTKKQLHYGFIAQDIEKIYPELVKKSEHNCKRVNYIELIPLLVSKIQMMQKEIDDLKTEIIKITPLL
jgi:hypothetical protein